MTDNLKFFDPETGRPLHRVPDGATIPGGMPHGCIYDGSRIWIDGGCAENFVQIGDVARFTREPIPAPMPPLPTEPGYYVDKGGDLWHVGTLGAALLMAGCTAAFGRYHKWDSADWEWGPLTPVTLVPTETWDRLRVLDPEDTRDRVDADGDVIQRGDLSIGSWAWDLAEANRDYGPLRFADEVSSNE